MNGTDSLTFQDDYIRFISIWKLTNHSKKYDFFFNIQDVLKFYTLSSSSTFEKSSKSWNYKIAFLFLSYYIQICWAVTNILTNFSYNVRTWPLPLYRKTEFLLGYCAIQVINRTIDDKNAMSESFFLVSLTATMSNSRENASFFFNLGFSHNYMKHNHKSISSGILYFWGVCRYSRGKKLFRAHFEVYKISPNFFKLQ